MRRFISLSLALLMVLCIAVSHADGIPDLTGDWRLVYSMNGVDMLEMYLYLYEDNTMDVMFAGEADADVSKGTWSFDGETITLHVDGDLVLTWDAENHRLVGEQEGVTVTMSLPIEPEGGDAVPAEEEDNPLGIMPAGGWTLPEDPAVTEEITGIFWQGMDSFQTGIITVSYTPVAYLGSQLVAGTNHAVLCRAQEINHPPVWVIVYLYLDLEGNVSVIGINELPLSV